MSEKGKNVMTELSEGNFSIDFGIIKLGGKLTEQDRQCAWELYTEIVTRVSVTGKRIDESCTDFSGELLMESLDSLYSFFQETRQIMKKYPVGKINENNQKHLGVLMNDILNNIMRPFLEKWQVDYRVWWERQNANTISIYKIQKKYPKYNELIKDWIYLRKIMRNIEMKILQNYKLRQVN
jgi:hypothetical protein